MKLGILVPTPTEAKGLINVLDHMGITQANGKPWLYAKLDNKYNHVFLLSDGLYVPLDEAKANPEYHIQQYGAVSKADILKDFAMHPYPNNEISFL